MRKKLYAYKTLNELIYARAKDTKKGILFITAKDKEHFVSYADFYQQALFFLGTLQGNKNINKGDEIIIYEEDNHKFLIAFWACLLGGYIPVPVAIGGKEEHRLKLFRIWNNLLHSKIVTTQENLEKLISFGTLKGLINTKTDLKENFISSSDVFNNSTKGIPEDISSNDLAFIQYSSGSTGNPKGVMLTHENLIYNTYDINVSIEMNETDNYFCWIPLTHDMGMIAFHLSSVVAGCNHMMMPTSLFIRRPLLWMEKTHEHRATRLCSPNFGYQYFSQAFNRKFREDINWDLSCVKSIVNGAEPISKKVCSNFTELLSPYNLSDRCITPCYGLAEASVGVSGGGIENEIITYFVERKSLSIGKELVFADKYEEGKTLSFVGVGEIGLSCNVSINDEEGNSLEKNTLGYIDIKGKNVTQGYYQNPEATKAVFIKDGWLRTGDLGFLSEDGTLVITGRHKNMIILQGQNYYAHDIEDIIIGTADITLGKVAVCGVSGNGDKKEELLVFVYYKKKITSFLNVIKILQKRLSQALGIIPNAIIPVLEIPKTTSGKVQHNKLLKRYQEGDFDEIITQVNTEMLKNTVQEWENSSNRTKSINTWLMALCVEIINDNDMTIDVQIPLGDQGFKSIHIVQLSQLLKTRLGLTTETSTFYKYPTILKLSEYIENHLFISNADKLKQEKSEEESDTDLLEQIAALSEEDILKMLEV